MLEPMKSVSMARRALVVYVALCLLSFSPFATAQPVASDAAATMAAAPATSASDVASSSEQQQAIQEPQADEDQDVDRVADETDPSALTVFRPAIDPYGVWVQHPTWGLVWVPNSAVVGSGFAPYVTSGHWALSEGGEWVWVSDLPFGWIVFHYGRWVSISGVGWAWIPGRRYAPAWVQWRVPDAGYEYVGWGPLPPTWIWVNGVAVVVWYPPPTVYVFCPSYYAFHHRPYAFFVRDPVLVTRLGRHTHRYGPNGYRHAGPSMAQARIPPRAVPRHRVASSARPDRRNAGRRHAVDRGSRRSRTAATPTTAGPSVGDSSAVNRAVRAVPSRPTRASRVPTRASGATSASRTGPVSRQRGTTAPRIRNDRTTGRVRGHSGPGRGFVPRIVPSSGARKRR